MEGVGREKKRKREHKKDEYLFFQQKYSHFTLNNKLPTSVLQATQVVKPISV